MVIYFCPNCWSELNENFMKCPICGYNIEEFEKLSYEDKLITALGHPVKEFRMNAIMLLGNMKSIRALSHFERIIDEEDDIFILLEVINSLVKINSQRSLKLLKRLTKHKSRVVSGKAAEHLKTA